MLRFTTPCLRKNYRYRDNTDGAIAQLGERLLCTQEVCGSIPHSSTIFTANTRKLQSEPEKVHCEVLLFKNLDQAEN